MFRHISRTYSITPQSQFENNSRDTVPLNCPECSDSIHGPNRPRNEKNPPEKKMHGAVKFTGALIVITLAGEIIVTVTLASEMVVNSGCKLFVNK